MRPNDSWGVAPGCHESAAFSAKRTHRVCVNSSHSVARRQSYLLSVQSFDSRRQDLSASHLKEKFKPAVIVSRQRGHDAFLADFAPVTFVENVPDTGEYPGSPLPKPKLRR